MRPAHRLHCGSAAAQAFAAQALANAAAYDQEEGQNAISRAGAVPLLIELLGSLNKAQMPAAGCLATKFGAGGRGKGSAVWPANGAAAAAGAAP